MSAVDVRNCGKWKVFNSYDDFQKKSVEDLFYILYDMISEYGCTHINEDEARQLFDYICAHYPEEVLDFRYGNRNNNHSITDNCQVDLFRAYFNLGSCPGKEYFLEGLVGLWNRYRSDSLLHYTPYYRDYSDIRDVFTDPEDKSNENYYDSLYNRIEKHGIPREYFGQSLVWMAVRYTETDFLKWAMPRSNTDVLINTDYETESHYKNPSDSNAGKYRLIMTPICNLLHSTSWASCSNFVNDLAKSLKIAVDYYTLINGFDITKEKIIVIDEDTNDEICILSVGDIAHYYHFIYEGSPFNEIFKDCPTSDNYDNISEYFKGWSFDQIDRDIEFSDVYDKYLTLVKDPSTHQAFFDELKDLILKYRVVYTPSSGSYDFVPGLKEFLEHWKSEMEGETEIYSDRYIAYRQKYLSERAEGSYHRNVMFVHRYEAYKAYPPDKYYLEHPDHKGKYQKLDDNHVPINMIDGTPVEKKKYRKLHRYLKKYTRKYNDHMNEDTTRHYEECLTSIAEYESKYC